MNAYFFKMNQAEKNNILDQHKKVYDGFVTTYGQQINQQPLYVQDYANDKEGLTVNNKGVVKTYTNMNINEADAMTGAKYLPGQNIKTYSGPYDPFEKEYKGSFTGDDKIGGKGHMNAGTFETEEPLEIEFEIDIEDPKYDGINLSPSDVEDVEEIEQLEEQLNKTLDMFKRFKNY